MLYITMRNVSRRSFTVEVKSDRRRPTTFIPTRVAAPSVPPLRLKPEPMPGAKAPVVEKRRVLPTLLVPEVPLAEPEPMLVAEERQPARPRGRPRKPRPAASEPVAEIIVEAAPAPTAVPQMPINPLLPALFVPLVRKRKVVPLLDLPRGERWKRRLGRWSR